jgi:adenylate cyclase
MAVLVPAMALAGFVTVGRELQTKAAAEPEWLADLAARQRWPDEATGLAFVAQGERLITWVYIGLVAATLLTRLVRRSWLERRNSVVVRFAGDHAVRVPKGTSLLEASHAAGIAHASVCGGHGRCSTCRVQVMDGLDALPAPAPAEQRALQRLSAPRDVRLGCQTRPTQTVNVRPLMPTTTAARNARQPMDPSHGFEREVTVLFADLRGFTRLSEQRLPFDTIYVLNRYFQAIGGAIEKAGGHVDKFIGEGIMALFGLEGDAAVGATRSLRAAIAMQAALEQLNVELEGDVPEPLRMVIALHQGTMIVGEMGYGKSTSLTAVGDAVNVTSRLEGIAKEADVPLVVSADLLERAGVSDLDLPIHSVEIRGRREPLGVILVPEPRQLPIEPSPAGPAMPRRRWRWPAGAKAG